VERIWKEIYVKWFPFYHDMARPQVADGGDGLQILRVAANILSRVFVTNNAGSGLDERVY
jgi:hypothetical protein